MAKIYYRLYQIDRIGQLYDESFCLRNLYPDDEIAFIVPEISEKVNNYSLQECFKGKKIYKTNETQFLNETHRVNFTEELINFEDGYLYSKKPKYLTTKFRNKFRNQKALYYHDSISINNQTIEKFKEDLKINLNDKIVTLHIREKGYLSGLNYHSYRNMDFKCLNKLIYYLIDSGFTIVRLGDPTMKDSNIFHDKFIDLTKTKYYNTFAESLIISNSILFIGTISGPFSIAQTKSIPILAINQERPFTEWGSYLDFDLPRNYYSKKLKRNLTFSEIIFSKLYGFYDTEEYANNDILLIQNNQDEILISCQEMLHNISLKNKNFNNVPILKYYENLFNYSQENRNSSLMQYKNIPNNFINKNNNYFGHLI